MSAGDTGLLDAASVVDSTPTTDTSSTEVSTTTPTSGSDDLQVITASEEGAEDSAEEGKETELKNADGTEKTPEQQKAFKETAAKGVDASIIEQRNALKALKELDPKYAKAVASLHGAAERWAVAKDLLSNGPDGGINGLKLYFQALGVKDLPAAVENLRSTNSMLEAVRSSDEALYAADPILSGNVYEDMKAQGKEDAYGKVVGNFLDHLKEVDSSAYYEVAKTHMVSGLAESGLPASINAIHQALASGDTNKAKLVLKNIADWYVGLRDEVGEESRINKALSEREQKIAAKEQESVKAARTATENGIATECERSSNVELGKFLGQFLRLPFFKEFSRESKVDLGNGIKERLYAALKADKGYQSQMSALWGSKNVDKAKMLQVHHNWLTSNGDALVRNLITTRYPGYAKGGMAAGRAASAAANKTAGAKAAASSTSTGKPIYVAARPTNIVHSDIKVGGRTYTSNDLQVLQIAGKGFVKTTDGKSVKFVTWRKQ